MADKIRVNMKPTRLFVKPSGNGNFSTANNPSPGAFPVVTNVELSLDQRNGGTLPVVMGHPQSAVVEIWARLKDPNNPTAAYTQCGTIGATKGKLSLLTTGLQFSAMIKDPKNPNSNVMVTEFTQALLPSSVGRSDFLLNFTADGNTVAIDPTNPLIVQLPWVFDGKNNIIQVNARIVVAGNVEVDITGPAANQPIDIFMRHDSVPDDGVANQVSDHPLLGFFGTRHIYTMSLRNRPVRPKIPFAGQTLRVWLHSTVNALLPAANLPQLSSLIIVVLNDLGFSTVTVDGSAAAVAAFAGSFTPVTSTSGATWLFSNRVSTANGKKYADDQEAGKDLVALDTEAVPVPFFDFFVVAENVNPPSVAPDELGHGENIFTISATGPTKSVWSPIILTAGSSQLNGLRKFMGSLSNEQKAIVIAQVICHEIGHSLGLRHSVEFPNSLPYKQAKDPLSRGVMASAQMPPAVPANMQPVPFQFFGPVHQLTIRQWYL